MPKAKIAVHQTWAYEEGCKRLNDELGYTSHIDMFNDIKSSYSKAAEAIGADFIIPCGEVFQKMLASGIEKVHRDTFHAGCGIGRYALGLTWYKMLSGNDVLGNTFSDFDEEIPPEHIKIAKKCVEETYKLYRN